MSRRASNSDLSDEPELVSGKIGAAAEPGDLSVRPQSAPEQMTSEKSTVSKCDGSSGKTEQADVETVVDLQLIGGNMQGRPPRGWIAERFDELESRLLAYVLRRLNDAEIARDVVQEAFVKLCQQRWPDIEPHAQAWLYKTCRNRAIDISRREGRMSQIHQGTDVATLHDRTHGQPEESLERDEQLQRVITQVRDLPERQQEILRLRLHDGLSYKQIAEVTGLTVTNVGYILHQTLTRLRGRLQAES